MCSFHLSLTYLTCRLDKYYSAPPHTASPHSPLLFKHFQPSFLSSKLVKYSSMPRFPKGRHRIVNDMEITNMLEEEDDDDDSDDDGIGPMPEAQKCSNLMPEDEDEDEDEQEIVEVSR